MQRASASEAEKKGNPRELAVEILLAVERRKAYADLLLDSSLRRKEPLSPPDRALLTQLVYGTLRWRGRIDWLLGQYLERPLSRMNPYLRNLLRLSLYQLFFLRKVPDYAAVHEGVELAKRYGGARAAALVNGVARKILREKEKLSLPDPKKDAPGALSVIWSHPEWLVRRWLDQFGREETELLLEANNEDPPLTLRANRLRTDRDVLVERLRARGLDAAPARWSPQAIHLRRASAPDELPGYKEGFFQIQGEASQLVGRLLDPKPGERVLDGCAAPGGKTTHIAELMGDSGEIIATDISARGLEKLRGSAARLGLKSIRPFHQDAASGLSAPLAAPYDRILVDAPCTGLGTLRSHPEAKWHREERDIQRLSALQKKILNRLSPYLKPGGILVYATCTLTREENEEVVEDFLARQRDFILEDPRDYLPQNAGPLLSGIYFLALPHKHETDGFFAARMRKVASHSV